MLQLFGFISGILAIICYFPYIRDILKRTTKPERASWLIWTILGIIAFFSQLADGATNSLWITGVETLGVFVVLALAIRFGVGGLTKRDIFALACAAAGLVLWYFTHEALTALVIVIAIDAIGSILTIVKAYRDPASETFSTWFIAGIAGIFAMLAVGQLDYALLLYPFYLFLMNASVCLAMIAGRRRTASTS